MNALPSALPDRAPVSDRDAAKPPSVTINPHLLFNETEMMRGACGDGLNAMRMGVEGHHH